MNAPPRSEPGRQLDEQALARLRELDPDGRHGVVARVLRTFETSLVRQMAQMVEARDGGDAATIGTLAHTLKSSAASIGALALSAQCAEIERLVRAGETTGLARLVENLLSEAEQVLGAVRAMLRT